MARKEQQAIRNEHRLQDAKATPGLEWLASGVGLLLTLGIFASIGWQVLDSATDPPIVRVEIERVMAVEGGYRVEFRARNMTGSTAAQVEIEGTLTGNGNGMETSRAVFDYIPGRSERKGGLFFIRDPRSGRLSLRATGYASP
jgi:uncharacterized protein (TIGR02588 family)